MLNRQLIISSEALIRSVYKDGGMNPADTGYVEAHGKLDYTTTCHVQSMTLEF